LNSKAPQKCGAFIFNNMEQVSSQIIRQVFTQQNGQVTSKFIIREAGRVKFQGYIFEDDMVVDYVISPGILFEDCTFKGNVLFAAWAKVKGVLLFIRCKFLSNIEFAGGEYNSYVTFEDCENAESHIDFKSGSYQKEVRIERGNISNLNFFGGQFSEVVIGAYAHETFIKNIFLSCSRITGSFSFFRVIGFEFNLRGILSKDSYIDVSESIYKHFSIYEFSNLGRLRFGNISFKELAISSSSFNKVKEFLDPIILDDAPKFSTFYIQKSVLDNVEFFSVDFKSFEVVSIRESSLNNIIVSNVTWPEKIFHFRLESKIDNRLPFTKLPLTSKDYLLIKENYRQLKYALSKQGDLVNEHYFHGLEMRAYNQSLPVQKLNNIGAKLILNLSYITSDYGQSIGRPFWSLLIGHLLFFTLALALNGFSPLHFSFENPTWEGFRVAFEKFFIYINPLRRTEASLSGYLIIIDLCMRIWASFMIYNIIRASRRFIK